MKIIETADDMRAWSREMRLAGRRIAFVPTMGALHEGHLSLLREGKKRGDLLVLSIYVNPAQFGPAEDLAHYPRDIDGDLAKAGPIGIDAVFLPSDEMMYPRGAQTWVTVEEATKALCGLSRPGHFRGVATVVAKLFNIVEPHVALFGEKDFQQLVVIRTMVRDLAFPVEIVGCPIVREADGLAMSSRNAYLSKEERAAATSLSQSLDLAERLIAAGEADVHALLAGVRATVESTGMARVDYARLVDPGTLADLAALRRPALLALAAFIGRTRLIDNRLFS